MHHSKASNSERQVQAVSEKNKGLSTAHLNLQSSHIPINTIQVSNILNSVNANAASELTTGQTGGSKRGQVANKNLQLQHQTFGKTNFTTQ